MGTQTLQKVLLLGQFEVKHGWAEGGGTGGRGVTAVEECSCGNPQGMHSHDFQLNGAKCKE